MSDKKREEWTGKDTAECVGMLLLTGGALAAWTGHLSLDKVPGYVHAAAGMLVPAAVALAGLLVTIGVLMFAIRHLRVSVKVAGNVWWRYRRHWAQVMTDHGLVAKSETGIEVPRLVSAVTDTATGADVVKVRMLPGQSAGMWHDQSSSLAAAFNASGIRVRFGDNKHRDIDLVVTRDQAGLPASRKPLELPAPQAHPIPLRMPLPGEKRPRQDRVAVRLSGIQIQIVWARTNGQNQHGAIVVPRHRRWNVAGRVNVNRGTSWATVAI